MMNWRLIPPALLTVLVVVRLFYPPFLSTGPAEGVSWLSWTSWYGILFFILFYASAWCWTPAFMRLAHRVLAHFAKWGLVPPLLFIFAVVGLLWFGDFAWNHTVHAIWPQTIQLDMLGGFTSIASRAFGGS